MSFIRHPAAYGAVSTLSAERVFPVWKLCGFLHITRSAYYRWLKHPKSSRELENELIAGEVEKIHSLHTDMGYRRIRDELDRHHGIHVNDKRVLRIDRALHIQSSVKYRRHGCTKSAASPEYIAKNYLNRKFYADAPNRKWLTDVTEFKYFIGPEIRKVYLSAILDLYDRRIVAYAVGDHNDNRLVFNTLDAAVAANPDAHPLFHSDRGYQYTSRSFHSKLHAAKMKQSMSRVAHCIDNGPMEGFWGILKREMYYGRKFTDRKQITQAISEYIYFYNYRRLQRRLSVMTPMEFHAQYAKAA
ncbi:IS3 family transposase [Caproiciproducens sp. CPB-2]|uniref:IS3 family transposase n=2 Tax=Caproiciproducens sp. CPB-2 TaxID=3030017 RepID=UPI002E340BA6|nr:IS3 family transposase [Caproiciproducens sp. CPB-2]